MYNCISFLVFNQSIKSILINDKTHKKITFIKWNQLTSLLLSQKRIFVSLRKQEHHDGPRTRANPFQMPVLDGSLMSRSQTRLTQISPTF